MSYRSLIADMQVPYCAKSHQRIRNGLLEYECKLLGGCLIIRDLLCIGSFSCIFCSCHVAIVIFNSIFVLLLFQSCLYDL